MRIYKIVVNDNKFEYCFITDTINLLEWNKILKTSHNYYPQLDSNDTSLMRDIGGTVIYRSNNNDYTYLIDIDFVFTQGYRQSLEDPYLLDKFETFRKSVKRDMELSKVLK